MKNLKKLKLRHPKHYVWDNKIGWLLFPFLYCNLNYFWLALSIWSSIKEHFYSVFLFWLLLLFHGYYWGQKNGPMLACPALDIDSVESGDHYFWRMRGGWVWACALGRGPSKWFRASTATAGSQCFGVGCDSHGDRCKWGLHPQSSEVWMGKDMEQRNAIFHWEPSGKTWLLNQCSYLALKGNNWPRPVWLRG